MNLPFIFAALAVSMKMSNMELRKRTIAKQRIQVTSMFWWNNTNQPSRQVTNMKQPPKMSAAMKRATPTSASSARTATSHGLNLSANCDGATCVGDPGRRKGPPGPCDSIVSQTGQQGTHGEAGSAAGDAAPGRRRP